MNPQVTNLAIILGMMQVTKRIPFDDPNTLNIVRAAYVVSNILIISLYAYVNFRIKKVNDQTTLKYVKPANPLSGQDQPTLETETVREYDLSQLKSSFKSVLFGVAMMAFMHLKLGYTNPLVVQSIIPLKTALESKLVQIHVFGKPAIGDLKRPWKAGAGFMGAQGEVKTDKKSIEEAEKRGQGGVKEE